jgi:hypothetical protein
MKVALDAAGWPKSDPELWLDLARAGLNPDGAVIDAEFKTVDCFIMVPCDTLTERYIARYQGRGGDAE